MIDLLGQILELKLNIRPRLMLVDHIRLVELARAAQPRQGHDREQLLGLFVSHGRQRFIYIQEYLPRILMIQVIAHEFTHTWQGENAPFLRDPLLSEGLAEWAAYHMLQALGSPKKAMQMRQRRDIYGRGLDYWLQVEKASGRAAVLTFCRHPGRAPLSLDEI
ncbi:MAG: hypothetical protein WCF84_14170 [Anaerolineae bacterium]